MNERQESLAVLATKASTQLAANRTSSALGRIDRNYDDFSLVEVTDLNGKVLDSSRKGGSVDVAGRDWFHTAATGQPVVTSPARVGNDIRWIIAQPVLDGSDRPVAVVIGDLNPTVLATLLNPELDEGSEVVAVDNQRQLIYSSQMGEVADDAAMLAAGALSTTVDNTATRKAFSTGGFGVARFTDDDEGHDVIGGYDVVDDLHWAVLAYDSAVTVLAPVTSEAPSAPSSSSSSEPGLLFGAALLFGVWESRKLEVSRIETASAGGRSIRRPRNCQHRRTNWPPRPPSRARRSPRPRRRPRNWPGLPPRSPTPSTRSPGRPPRPRQPRTGRGRHRHVQRAHACPGQPGQ